MLNKKFQSEAQNINLTLQKASKILIVSHKNPDGDTMGSALAMYEYLQNIGKEPSVFCVDPYPANFFFLPNYDKLQQEFNLENFDLVICFDAGADYMTGLTDTHPQLFGGKFPLINIDHHPTNKGYGKWNIVDEHAASTTLILTEFFQYLGIEINHRMATCLLCGLYTDTGSFQHSNTDPRGLRAASFLVKQGASIRQVRRNIFHNNKISTLRLWGRVLDRAYKDSKGVVISHVHEDDFLETGSDSSDLSGVIDFLNSVPNAKFSLLLTEKGGKVKASFRTMDNEIDVAEIAGQFGGGGHKKAAGFTMPGRLEKEVRWKVVSE